MESSSNLECRIQNAEFRTQNYVACAVYLLLFLVELAPAASLLPSKTAGAGVTVKPGPSTIPCFDVYEIVLQFDSPPAQNPFTGVEVKAAFTPKGGAPVLVEGFCDDQTGRIFRVRFCPSLAATEYRFSLTTNVTPGEEQRPRSAGSYTGFFQTTEPQGMEPVIVNPQHPKHFQFAGSGRPFYHLGFTAYHLLDPSNTDGQIRDLLDYCVQRGFNKVRFLLTGYPRDTDPRVFLSEDRSGGSKEQYSLQGDPWKLPNYGAPPGEVNPLPAWLGNPHGYDFTRFNVAYWQKVDRAVQAMRQRGIVATCIVTIEKQNLPQEYGALTEHEQRLYRYAVARLAAFSNVWWDLGNEHNEYRKQDWAPQIGRLVKQWDPYDRLCSAHGYADWLYDNQPWADFIITQQYGTCAEVNRWALKYRDVPKPYVNEEYGYEGILDQPGHGMNADLVRKCHWSIAMAGGYGSYGDWTPGSTFYTGHIGSGKAAFQLRHLRQLFESLPFPSMRPQNELVGSRDPAPREPDAFCLAKSKEVYLVYLPNGGETVLHIEPVKKGYTITWIDPRTGEKTNLSDDSQDSAAVSQGEIALRAPSSNDWTVIIKANQ
jgi:hypothetical protein